MVERWLCGVAAAALLAGCTLRPGTDGVVSPVVTGQRRVTYSVRCRECTAIFSTAEGSGRQAVKGSWSTTVGIDPNRTSIVSLDVMPASRRDRVYRAVIELDGRKVAEAGDDVGSAFSDDVRLTAVVAERAPGR
jgi:hypothetical protein